MSKFNGKVRMKVAQSAKANKFDLSCVHLNTMDFYTPRPVYVKEVIPNESLSVNMESFTRLSPLVEPFLGACRIVSRGFFVPFRLVMEGFNDFLTDSKVTVNGILRSFQKVPTFTNENLISLFDNSYFGHVNRIGDAILDTILAQYTTTASSGVRYDFMEDTSDGTRYYYKFTAKGKQFFNILTCLGYKLNFPYTLGTTLVREDTVFSALPLLCYAKVFRDWFNNTNYSNFVDVDQYFKGVHSDFSSDVIYKLLDCTCNVNYDSDYFTSAFDNPTNANDPLSSIRVPDITVSSPVTEVTSSVGPDIYDTPQIETSQVPGQKPSISQFMIDAVKHVTDYIRRKQYVGNKTIDRYEAEFGIRLDSAKVDRSFYLGKNITDIAISDVMQSSSNIENGSSVDSGLGSYAGKGLGYGSNGNYKFTSDEFGVFFIVSYIEPKVINADGRPRYLQHINRFDFFTPELDQLRSVQVIRKDELCAGVTQANVPNYYDPKGIFGFTNLYAEYKVANDNISGDFLLASKNTSLDGWILRRNMSPDFITYNMVAAGGGDVLKHNANFCTARPFFYQNIFVMRNDASGLDHFDHFFCQFKFDVTSYLHALPLYDTYDFHSEGKEKVMNVNGSQVTNM